jgi:peptide deformylase
MAVILKLCEAGEPVLRERCRELAADEIMSPPIQDLIASMFETMRAAPGVGLAAPQIAMPLQLAVIEDRQEYLDKMKPASVAERLRAAVSPHVIIKSACHGGNPGRG